jgi:ABC-type sugar transport system ATPase subunit
MLGRELERAARRQAEAGGEGGPSLLDVERLAAGRKVRDVSFNVAAGEIVGLAGLLGSGRTESARVVFGADRAKGARCGSPAARGRAGSRRTRSGPASAS